MANYIIKESQLNRIVRNLTESPNRVSAMRKIMQVLKEKGWEPEQIVDFLIGLRKKDEFTKEVSKQFEHDPEYYSAAKEMLNVED